MGLEDSPSSSVVLLPVDHVDVIAFRSGWINSVYISLYVHDQAAADPQTISTRLMNGSPSRNKINIESTCYKPCNIHLQYKPLTGAEELPLIHRVGNDAWSWEAKPQVSCCWRSSSSLWVEGLEPAD